MQSLCQRCLSAAWVIALAVLRLPCGCQPPGRCRCLVTNPICPKVIGAMLSPPKELISFMASWDDEGKLARESKPAWIPSRMIAAICFGCGVRGASLLQIFALIRCSSSLRLWLRGRTWIVASRGEGMELPWFVAGMWWGRGAKCRRHSLWSAAWLGVAVGVTLPGVAVGVTLLGVAVGLMLLGVAVGVTLLGVAVGVMLLGVAVRVTLPGVAVMLALLRLCSWWGYPWPVSCILLLSLLPSPLTLLMKAYNTHLKLLIRSLCVCVCSGLPVPGVV